LRTKLLVIWPAFLIIATCICAQQTASLSPLVQKYVRVSTPRIVLEHVRVIDGTGAAAFEDRNVVIENGKVATLNGALYLDKQDQIGSIAAGRNADLMVIKGNPAAQIADIEKVEIVFKDGVGYDSQKLVESVRGRYGEY
jgi:hypothetical protein